MIELLRRRLIGGKGSAVARLEQVCIAFQPDESAVALKVFDIQGVFDDAAACGNDEVIPGRNLMDDLRGRQALLPLRRIRQWAF